MPSLGALEIGIIALLILVFFGGKKIPEFVRSLGESVREFNKGARGEDKK